MAVPFTDRHDMKPAEAVRNSVPSGLEFELSRTGEPLLQLFEEVAREQEWLPGDYLQRCADHSVFIGLKADGRLIGGMQLALGNAEQPLPCLRVWPELLLIAGDHSAEAAVLALRPELRGKRLMCWLLAVEAWRFCSTHDFAELWMAVTPRRLRQYAALGWPLQVMGKLRPHWGEECYPCRVVLEDAAEYVRSRAVTSRFHADLVDYADTRPSREAPAVTIPILSDR